LEGEFLVDGFVSLKGEYGGGNLEVGSVATNGSFKAEGKSKVTGKLFLGPQGVYKIEGGAEVRGGIERLTQSIVIPDFESAFLRAKEYNDNEKIPSGFLKEGVLKLEGGKELELPSGVYYLKGIKLEGKSKLKFQGIAFVFLEGGEEKGKEGEDKGKGNGKGKREGKEKSQEKGEEGFCLSVQGESAVGVFPSELRVIAKCGVKVESKSKIYGFVASGGDVKVEGGGEIFGGVLAKKFKGEGKGKVHFDRALSSLWIKWGDGRRGLIALPRFQIITVPQDRDLGSVRFSVMTFADLVGPDLIPTTIGGGIRGTKTVIVEIERLEEIERIKDEIDPIFQGPVMFFADYMAFTGLVAPYLVVTINPNYGPSEIFSDYGITEFRQITPFRYIVAPKVKNAFEIFSILERFLSDLRIIHADPDTIALMGLLQARREPNDPRYGDQWYLRTVLAPEGWIFVYGGRIDGVQVFPVVSTQMIAIVDSGVDPDHEDLRDILYYGSTGDRTITGWHGTEVAGVAGAHTNNSTGIAGMMWTSPDGDRIIPYDYGDGGIATIGEALEDIIDAAGVEEAVAVNASWGFAHGSFTAQQLALLAWPLYCARSEALTLYCDVLTYVASTGECQVLDITLPGGLPPRGTSLVFAAGNGSGCCRLLPWVPSPTNNPDDYECLIDAVGWVRCPTNRGCQFVVFQGNEPDQCRLNGRPAACYCPFGRLFPNGVTLTEPQRFARQPCFEGMMITVGATDQNENRADFSTVAPHVTVSAPGDNILTTGDNPNTPEIEIYSSVRGTSFSAPLVTGLVGLLSKLNPLLSVQEIFDIVTSTARDRGDQGRDNIFGYGRIDVRKAIMKTLFYGEPLYLEDQELSGPFTISFTNSTVGTVKSTQLVFWNLRQGRGVMYALVVLEPLSTDNVRVVSFTINGTPVEGNRAVVILSPGRSATVRLDFELIKDANFDETFMLKVYTNYGIRPSDLQEFGGTLPFPITTPADFQDKGDLEGRAIRVTRTVCGDGVCGGDENCINCAQDCGECPTPPGGGSACVSFCKLPLCIPIFCLPKVGCIYICFPPPGWAICPFCCLWCLFVFGDPGPGIPEEIPPELADIMQSPECNLCSESLKSEGGSAFGKPECKLCIEKVVQRGASLSYQCDMCLMNIRDYGEQGADSSWCAICKDQWEAMYEAYKDAVQSTMP
jgi:hypothetical protein